MTCGKSIRMRRLFTIQNNGALIVPMDHGITYGPIEGINDIGKLLSKIRTPVTGVILHKGIYMRFYNDIFPVPFIMHLSASTTYSTTPEKKVLVSTVKEAIQLGATAVSIHINIGNDFESDMLKDFGKVSSECNEYGIPLLAMVYGRGNNIKDEFAPDVVAHCIRIAEELGADIVKTNYTGDMKSFREVVSNTHMPVLIAGGKRMDSTAKLYAIVKDAMKAGAKGVSIGRNIFQSNNPRAVMSKIYEIIYSELDEQDDS